MKKINVGLIGFGTVGAGVVKILTQRTGLIRERIGVDIVLKKIADKDLSRNRGVKVEKSLLTKDAYQIINDPAIDIVIELVGGIHPAKEFISDALKKGKNVVTANKALLAQEGKDLFNTAASLGKSIYFEASVGGGIPIIKSLREGLVANRFNEILGIINGTSNYILSRMSETGCDFSDALREAKEKGYAERNPSLDIDGVDSAHKLVILTYLAFGKFVSMDEIFIEGIRRISALDIKYADELGLTIKLLAIAKKDKGELEVRVTPTLISKDHLLAPVNRAYNAIYVSSDLAGSLLFSGKGAGQLPTASAVVSDLVDLTKDIKAGMFKSSLNIAVDNSIKRIRKIKDIESRYYIRFMAIDKPGVFAKISGILGKFNISIASVNQKERRHAKVVPVVMIIHEAKEGELEKALLEIDKLSVIREKAVVLRMEELS